MLGQTLGSAKPSELAIIDSVARSGEHLTAKGFA